MAKYTRYDLRNKNKGRNKARSLEKDHRIRDEEYSKNVQRSRKIDWVSDEIQPNKNAQIS